MKKRQKIITKKWQKPYKREYKDRRIIEVKGHYVLREVYE